MTSLRDARAAVIRRHYRGLADDYLAELPRLLDDLERVDTEHGLLPSVTVDTGEADRTLAGLRQRIAELEATTATPEKPAPARARGTTRRRAT